MADVSKYFWVLFIGATLINAAIARAKAQNQIKADPSLAEGYRRLLRGFVFWMNLPWVAMGILCMTGLVPTMYHFGRPLENPFVLGWYGLMFLLWGALAFWVFYQGGAELLARHPCFFNVQITNPKTIKLLTLALLLGAMVGVAMICLHPAA